MNDSLPAGYRVEVVDYADRKPQLRVVRDAVFIAEQGVDPAAEFDDRDPFCRHALVTESGEPVATGRMDLRHDLGQAPVAKLGRVAVLADRRGRGLGRVVMAALEDEARQTGASLAVCHAQVAAEAFYESLGYRRVGDEFDEEGIRHVRMEKKLS